MKQLQRLAHYVTGEHTWRLAVDTGHGKHPATAHLTCVPCRITRDIPDHQHVTAPCFCQQSTCYGWQGWVAAFIAENGVAPNRADVHVNRQAHDILAPLSDRVRAGLSLDAVKADLYAQMGGVQ